MTVYIQLTPLLNLINSMYNALSRGYCESHYRYNPQCPDFLIGKISVTPLIDIWCDFVHILAHAAEKCIPRVEVNALKFRWSQEADDLKSRLIEAHRA